MVEVGFTPFVGMVATTFPLGISSESLSHPVIDRAASKIAARQPAPLILQLIRCALSAENGPRSSKITPVADRTPNYKRIIAGLQQRPDSRKPPGQGDVPGVSSAIVTRSISIGSRGLKNGLEFRLLLG